MLEVTLADIKLFIAMYEEGYFYGNLGRAFCVEFKVESNPELYNEQDDDLAKQIIKNKYILN